MKPYEFTYYSRTDSNKVLILVKIPELKHVKKKERLEVIELIETVLPLFPSMIEKEIYIGVEGKFSIMLLKTPTEIRNSRFASEIPLYDYYGPKIEEKEKETYK